ncbi:MAG: hypothetical protein U9Q68_01910 [Euryarchaeota archaeon]|nr:hypothetical protein [Euryarchaeota archaeon]
MDIGSIAKFIGSSLDQLQCLDWSGYMNNPIGIISFVIPTFLAIFFYLKGKKEKKPTFQIRSFNLVKEFSKKVTTIGLLYSGEKVENLTITKVIFWNMGNEPIRKDDIAVADPIRIVVDNKYEIFEAEILNDTANEANRFELVKNDNKSIIIAFDFLSHDEGVAIQIAHSGLSSEDVTLTGTIIGSGKPKEESYNYDQTYMEHSCLFMMVLSLGILFFECKRYIDAGGDYTINIGSLLFGLFLFIFFLYTYKLIKSHSIPKQFRSFILEEMRI